MPSRASDSAGKPPHAQAAVIIDAEKIADRLAPVAQEGPERELVEEPVGQPAAEPVERVPWPEGSERLDVLGNADPAPRTDLVQAPVRQGMGRAQRPQRPQGQVDPSPAERGEDPQ